MLLPMFMHDLRFLHIVCMFAAHGLQARIPHRGVVLVLSVMLCSEGLEKVVIPALRTHVISYHNMTLPGPEGPLLCRKNPGAQ